MPERMDRNIYDLLTRHTWFGETFMSRIWVFELDTPEETSWDLGEQLSERSHQTYEPFEAIAVFEAIQRSGPETGCPALLKFHMQ